MFLGGYGVVGFDDGGGDAVVMEEEELFGLFEVMGSLLEDPSWAQMHPQPCTDTPWPGVECELLEETSIFHVTKIHVGEDVVIPPCKASAKISESLLKLPFLRTLSLINCFTKTPFSLSKPDLFQSLSSIEHLTLESNPTLSGQIPSTISNLSALRILSLSQNNLSGQIPKEIGALINLQHLDLNHNSLSGSIPVEIGNLINLSILDFSYNSLQKAVPASIGRMQSLEKIDLSCNKLKGTLPQDLGNLRKLVLLDLSQNSLSGPIPETLSYLQQLQYLIMEGNPLNSRIPSFIGSLTQLRVVTFSGCGLTGPIPSPLSNLTNLTALSLDDNNLKGRVPPELGSLPNLGTLNLSGNLLTGELLFPQDFINRMGERLDIRENRGLCSNQELKTSNTSSRLSQNPTCSFPDARNKTIAERKPDEKMKPNLYGGNKSSNCHDSVENFPGRIVLLLLLNFCFSWVFLWE